jgi:hypothetical protein
MVSNKGLKGVSPLLKILPQSCVYRCVEEITIFIYLGETNHGAGKNLPADCELEAHHRPRLVDHRIFRLEGHNQY